MFFICKASLGLIMENQDLFEEVWKPMDIWDIVFWKHFFPTGSSAQSGTSCDHLDESVQPFHPGQW